jgi:uncharacterized protein (TIGR02271 family)
MSQDRPTGVVDRNGLQGVIIPDGSDARDSTSQVRIRFENGTQVVLPRELLHLRNDGLYHLALAVEEIQSSQRRGSERQEEQPVTRVSIEAGQESAFVLPVSREEVQVGTQSVETGRIAIHKTVQEQTKVVDEPLLSEEVEIERVAINRPVETPPAVRHEEDVLIIPLLEEVLFVEKRLVLREEIRVKKLRKEIHAPQQVTLRQEQVEIERKAAS